MNNRIILSAIELNGYKSIGINQHIRFDKINVLIGANGSGKSNLLSFFKMLNHMVSNNLRLFVSKSGYADSLLFGSFANDVGSCKISESMLG
jgi:predicted ATPase